MTIQEILKSLKKEPKTVEKVAKELKMKTGDVVEFIKSMEIMQLIYREKDFLVITDRGRKLIKK
ncbi:MAG: hypothetical protein J7J92_00760 [Candidatus Aenigmarchaeota archaeon]|nr:hypothetical protein [Candidatus Aenigmarchaeota archaeon]